MRGLGDFQRRQMKRGDPRIREVFSHLREILNLLENIANHPYQPLEREPESARAPVPTPPPSAPQPSAPLLVSIKEARRLIGVSNTRIYQLINDGSLETVRLGARRLIRYGSLQNLAGG